MPCEGDRASRRRAGEDPARDARAAPPARIWDRLWLCRLQRRGPAGHDAVHKLLLDRDPIAGRALASQPTLSRFENTGAMTPETASCAIPCAKGGH
jgi:hypothetical protein